MFSHVESGIIGRLFVRFFHQTYRSGAGGLFRVRRGLPPCNNEWGPLTDLPDFSIIDKPTPRFTSEGQRRRAIKNYQLAKDVVRLTSEIAETKSKYIANLQNEENTRKELQSACFKSKGSLTGRR